MIWQKSFSPLGIPALVFYPAFVISSWLSPQLTAQSYPEMKISLTFPPTEQRGAPPRTAGGGTRSSGASCVQQDEMPLTALMPSNNVGTTVAANPTFFWYVPKTSAKSAEFVVSDSKDKEVYRQTFALSKTPGIVRLTLPTTVSLEIGKNYSWQLALICDPETRDLDRFVQGWLQRTALSPEMLTKLTQLTPLEQARMYAQAGIWQETLTILAHLRSSRPSEWEELLRSVGLNKTIARSPFIDVVDSRNLSVQIKN